MGNFCWICNCRASLVHSLIFSLTYRNYDGVGNCRSALQAFESRVTYANLNFDCILSCRTPKLHRFRLLLCSHIALCVRFQRSIRQCDKWHYTMQTQSTSEHGWKLNLSMLIQICKKLQTSERIIVLDISVISCGRMAYFIYPERKWAFYSNYLFSS